MSDLNILPKDQNFVRAAGFESSSTAGLVMAGQIDEITGRILVDNAGSSGTVTSITASTGILLTPNPITTTGTVGLAASIAPIATLGSAGQSIRVNAGATALEYYTPGAGSGTVTAVSIATANGFSGSSSGGATPALTIVAGAITPTTVNGLTISTTTGTFTLTNAKTLAVTNTLTLSGTDSTVMTFPTTTATIARTDAGQTFTGLQTYSNAVNYTNNAIAASGNAATVPITARIHTVTNNSAATLTITLTTTSAVDGQLQMVRILDASAVAQTITWVNTEDSTVAAPTTSNGSTTLPLTVGFQYNSATSKWRCIASA